MRKLMAGLDARLKDFLGQRKNVLLVVQAGETEYLPLVSSIAGIENGGSPDDFLLFLDPFETPSQYANVLAQSLATRYAVIGPALRKEGRDVPAELPSRIADPRRTPVERVRDLFMFERDLIADLEATRVAVGLLPSRISDPAGYAKFVMSLIAHELPMPWCHHMRFIVREDSTALLTRHAQTLPRAEFYAPDFSQAAIAGSLEAEAFDDTQSLPVRMQSLILSAAMDYSHMRLPAALEKYSLATRYYTAVGPAVMLALALNGTGEVLARAGRPADAQRQFERALTPAAEAKSPPVLTNVTLNLANLHRQQGRWWQAYEHYQAVSALAKLQLNVTLQLRCLEQMGFCQHKLDDKKRAWEHWNAGVELARATDMKEDLLDCLQRIRGLYRELGMAARERDVAPEIATLERQGIKVHAA